MIYWLYIFCDFKASQLEGPDVTSSVSAGENFYPPYANLDDIKLERNWEGKYFLSIDTKNTSLAGSYKCQHSNSKNDIVHNVAVFRCGNAKVVSVFSVCVCVSK